MKIEGRIRIASVLLICNIAAAAAKSANSISLFSCEPREGPELKVAPGSKWFWPAHDAQHRGSELNDGRRANTTSDEECADICRKMEGLTEGSCQAMNMTGFRHEVPYNDPKLLFASSAYECCGRCHEHNELCSGWTWNRKTESCSLYANAVKESQQYMCRNCVSGIRKAHRESLPFECHAEMSGTLYMGVGNLTPDGSFLTKTSKECCKICARIRECKSWTWTEDFACTLNGNIPSKHLVDKAFGGIAKPKVCKPEACALEENVEFRSHNLVDTLGNAPFGRDLIVDSPEQCCLRCQEYPECHAFTYTKKSPDSESTGCWLKTRVSGEVRVGNCTGVCISGVVRSRLEASDFEAYQSRLQEARERIKKENSESNLPLLVVVLLSIFGILFAVCLCGAAAFLFFKERKRKFLIHESRLQKIYEEMRQSTTTTAADRSTAPDTINLHQEKFSSSRSTEMISFTSDSSIAPSSVAPLAREDRLQQLSRLRSQLGSFRKSIAGLEYVVDVSDSEPDLEETPLEEGTLFQGKFIVEGGEITTKTSIINFARSKFDRARPVVIKFYKKHACFKKELKFFELQLRSTDIPQVLDVLDEAGTSMASQSLPAIVFERGDYTLGTWLQRRARALDFMDQRNILFKLSSTLHFLHSHKIVHRDVKPENVVMFSAELTWKLIDYGCWAYTSEEVPIEYTLRYACPEVLSAHGRELNVIHANPAMDMWGLGLIFWEVMAGEPLFVDTISDEEVMAMLLGVDPLPFEKNEVLWEKIQPMAVQRIIKNLLKREPSARWPIQKVIANAFFAPGKDTIQAQQGTTSAIQEMTKHIGRIEERILELQEVAVENLKQTSSNVLIISINFQQIDETFESSENHPASLLERHIQGDLKVEEPLFQPNYSLFKREREDPCALLRLERSHILRVTFVNGGSLKTDVAVTSVEWIRMEVSEVKEDVQELVFCMYPSDGHVFEVIAFWDTSAHRDMTLHIKGEASVDVVMGIRIKGSKEVMVVRKTVDLKMYGPKEKFTLVKKYIRTLEWYSKLPQSTKVYLNGAIQVVQLVTKLH